MEEEKKEKIIKYLQTETINVLSYSYGKDSGACIGACLNLGIPIHAIVTADVLSLLSELLLMNPKDSKGSITSRRYLLLS